MSPVPRNPKIYHIVHFDRLASIIAAGHLFSDHEVQQQNLPGTNIGMNNIKARRLTNELSCHTSLNVGACVPFYFCPRSVMLYLIHRGNAELTYNGGQANIIHLEADLFEAVEWANSQNLRWAFTLSNAGSYYFQSRSDLQHLGDLNWPAIATDHWGGAGVDAAIKEGKQAEFLVEERFPWQLFKRIGIMNNVALATNITGILSGTNHKPSLTFQPTWYY